MRVLALAMMILCMAGPARAQTDIAMTCYTACEKSTHSNPEYKACLARAADKADRALNESYRALQTAIRDGAKAMGEKPDIQLGALTIAQKAWIAYRDANCSLEDKLAFGGTAIGGNASACLCMLSYQRIGDFGRMRKRMLFNGD
jgi:uncharacterized protein YecT (DUF1311 family)